MLTFSAATRAARCVVGSWAQGNVILRRTIVLQCPVVVGPSNKKLSSLKGDLTFKSAALAAFSSQRSLLSTAQAQSESVKAAAASSENAGEGEEKPKYKPLTKWQRWGYIFFGVNMFTIVIGRHVMSQTKIFC